MAWWDSILKVASSAWDVAKANPLATAGTAVGAYQGYKQGGLGGAVLGGVAGNALGGMGDSMGANQWFTGSGSGAPSFASAPTGPSMQGPTATLNAPTYGSIGSTAANFTPTAGAMQTFGAGVGDFDGIGSNPFGMAGPTSGGSLMDNVTSGVQKVSEFGQNNRGALQLGLQGYNAYGAAKQGQANLDQLNQIAGQEGTTNEANRKITEDRNAQEMAYSGRAPTDAYNNVMNNTTRQIAASNAANSNASSTQRDARARQLALAGSTGASTASANATRQPNLQAYATPNTQARTNALSYGSSVANNNRKNITDLAQVGFGWDDAERKKVMG